MPKNGGWGNWETWLMARILEQREDLGDWMAREIEKDDIESADAEGMIEQTGEKLRAFMDHDVPRLEFPWANLLEHTMESVDWKALARRYLIDTQRLNKRGRKPAHGPKEWTP